MRNSLIRFSNRMEETLQANDDKNGWNHLEITHLLSRVSDEVEELKKELLNQNTVEAMYECVDAANFLMMIFDNLHEKLKMVKHD